MLLKYFCWLLPFFVLVCGKSLTFVVDTTKSMEYELNVIKTSLTKFVEDVKSRQSINEFVLVKFRDRVHQSIDQTMEPMNLFNVSMKTLGLTITNDKIEFETLIKELSPEGGGECPENSLSAIQKALEKSQHNSLIYVMTDAYADDSNKLNDIKELCTKTGSQVSIFLSGTCVHNGTEEMSPEHLAIYRDVTKYCSGKLKVTNERGFREAFRYEEPVSEPIRSDYNPKEQVELVHEECSEEPPAASNDDCSKELFYFGMPFWPMHNGESDCKQYAVSAKEIRIIQEITKQVFDEYNKRKKSIVNKCHNKQKCETNPPKINTSCPSSPSPRSPIIVIPKEPPHAEITEPQNNQVEYGANISISCKITGSPQPNVTWRDNNYNTYQSETPELNAQNTYYSYIQLNNITVSESYNCLAANEAGSSVATIAIEVKPKNRFEIIRKPTDQTIEIYTEGRLECEADAYPEPEVTWYLNDTISFSYNIETDNGKLVIKNMTTEEVGNYTCVISNENESRKFNAFVYISGLEKPTVNIELDEIKAKPGQRIQVNCSATGKPVPVVNWSFKSKDGFDNYDFASLPTEMYVNEGVLYIDKVKLSHQGVFRCSVDNYFGYIYDDVKLSIGSPPQIENNKVQTITVIEKEIVHLKCKVKSDLPVKVKWEISNGEGIKEFNIRHTTDQYYTHSFTALWNDAGTYRCIAENEAGVTEKVINVDVHVNPYIKPTRKSYKVKSGCNVTLPCEVEKGNPTPEVYWEHKSYYYRLINPVKVQPNGPNNSLTLVDVHRSNRGIYTCTAKNVAASDTIDIELTVV